MKFAIQTTRERISSYEDIVHSYQLSLEITDFAYPSNFSVEAEHIIEFWINHPFFPKVEIIHGSYLDLKLHSIDPQIAKITQQRYLWNLGIADQLQATYTIFHSRFDTLTKTYLKQWYAEHDRFLRHYQSQYQSRIVFENEKDPSPVPLKVLTEKNQKNQVPVCLDIGYISTYSTEDLDFWFEQLGSHCEIIHLKEMNKIGNELALNKGRTDWQHVFDLIELYCNDPLLVLEMDGINKIENSLSYLESLELL